jgi:hypothetical protein
MVIFRTTNYSFHGHPYPLQTPPGVYRQSVAMYYFTSDVSPEESIRTSSTKFIETHTLGRRKERT